MHTCIRKVMVEAKEKDYNHLILSYEPRIAFNKMSPNKRLGLFIPKHSSPRHSSCEVGSWSTAVVFSIIHFTTTTQRIAHLLLTLGEAPVCFNGFKTCGLKKIAILKRSKQFNKSTY